MQGLLQLLGALEVFVCSVGSGDSSLRVSALEQLISQLPASGQARVGTAAALEGLKALLKDSGISGDSLWQGDYTNKHLWML